MEDRKHIMTLLLTGGIGCGKSLAAKYLADMGVPVYDFDSKTKELYDSDSELCRRVADAVSPYSDEAVMTSDGHIDRHALARVVFGNSVALASLEAVVHPAVLVDFRAWREDYATRFAEALASGGQKEVCGCLVSEKRGVRKLMVPIVAAESAIALSKPIFADEFDRVILITAPEEVRKSRAAARDGVTGAEIEARMQAQPVFPPVCKTPSAQTETADEAALPSPKIDYVIENNGEKAELSLKLKDLLMDIIGNWCN